MKQEITNVEVCVRYTFNMPPDNREVTHFDDNQA